MKRCILMNINDDGATALENINSGDTVNIFDNNNLFISSITAKENIPFGNKISLNNKEIGEIIYKYGEPIGIVTRPIKIGTLIHVHNVKSLSVDIPENIKVEIIRQMGIKVN